MLHEILLYIVNVEIMFLHEIIVVINVELLFIVLIQY